MPTLDNVPLLPRPRSVLGGGGLLYRPPGDAAAATWPPVCERTGPHLRPQGYRLTISPEGVCVEAGDAAGAFYGRMTLRQLARLCPEGIPCGEIEDWPDVPVRGVMLDISRDKVPTLETLFLLVDLFAEWKLNHLQLYMEHTFAYRNHGEVWADATPLTADEVRELDAYCRERFIELAPNQNSFGHFERWLKHPRYRPLAECPDGFETAAGERRDVPTTLDPANPATLELVGELYAELLPNFRSRHLHIGCDETWELGKGRSRAAVAQLGLHRVYLDYLQQLKALGSSHGRTTLYWGDMVWNHFPDRLSDLDREMVHVDWGYYRAYPFRAHGERLAAAGVPFWFAPGTSTWSSLVGCNEAAIGSNRSAAQAARACGAQGLLNTDWGDNGHWQQLPVSFIGFAAGAATAWCELRNPDEAIRAALDPHVFQDSAGVMGQAAWALADSWQHVAENATQSQLLDRILRGGLAQRLPSGVTELTLRTTEAHLQAVLTELPRSCPQRVDAALLREELAEGARLALHACRLGLCVCRGETGGAARRQALAAELGDILAERRRLWLARNRGGGLTDSLRCLEALRQQYLATL